MKQRTSAKKNKVSKAEYDILRTAIDYSTGKETFDDFCMLTGLLEKGYFKDAEYTMNVKEYFDNCGVYDDDEKS